MPSCKLVVLITIVCMCFIYHAWRCSELHRMLCFATLHVPLCPLVCPP